MNKYIDLLFKYLFGIMVVNDLLILARITNSTYYLVGIKFDVTYLHIMVLALFYYKYMMTEDIDRITWVKYIVLIAESVLIAKVVDCATGLVGAVLLVVMLFVHRNKNYIMNKRLLILLVAIACMLFPFWYNLILSNHYVTYFVEGILHKKITLTGRTYIYEIALVLLGDGWMTGYGIGTNYEICMRAGFVNIQNGFLKVFMDTGIIGGLSLLALVFLVFGRTRNSRKETIIFASYIFVFIILSSIEITIGNTFMFWLLFLFVYGRAVRNTNKK
ncbi:O-antigen ligase family protein [Pseudobutyrivibrio xylanivorans]|nr:O-antigen ligase family protein [Pseudobutyrivibrio xylanivorans]